MISFDFVHFIFIQRSTQIPKIENKKCKIQFRLYPEKYLIKTFSLEKIFRKKTLNKNLNYKTTIFLLPSFILEFKFL